MLDQEIRINEHTAGSEAFRGLTLVAWLLNFASSELGDWCVVQDHFLFGVSVVDMQCLDILQCKFDRRMKAAQNGSLFIRPGGMPGTSGRAKSRA